MVINGSCIAPQAEVSVNYRLFQNLGVRVIILPRLPSGIFRFYPRQKLVNMLSANPSKPTPFWVPEAHCLFVIKHKGFSVGPS